MDYFLLKQESRYTNVPIIKDVSKKIDWRNINILDANKIDDIIVYYVNAEKDSYFLDILDEQLYLVSKNMKDIIEKYVPDMIFKTQVLIDLEHKRQENYFLPVFEEIEALSSNSEFNLDKSIVKNPILDGQKIKNKKIFKIKESAKTLIVVRLDAAESILRRNFTGIKLEKIPVE